MNIEAGRGSNVNGYMLRSGLEVRLSTGVGWWVMVVPTWGKKIPIRPTIAPTTTFETLGARAHSARMLRILLVTAAVIKAPRTPTRAQAG